METIGTVKTVREEEDEEKRQEKAGDREDKPKEGDGWMKVETPPPPIIGRGLGSPYEVSQEVRDRV